MIRNRFLALAAVVVAVGLVAGPADASRQDTWLGHPFMWHLTDVTGYPHRAVMWNNQASAIFVPQDTESSDPYDDNARLMGVATLGKDQWSIILAANEYRAYNPVKSIGGGHRMPAAFMDMGPGVFPDGPGASPLASVYQNPYGIYQLWGLSTSEPNLMIPAPQMQLGFAYSLNAVDLGFFWTTASSQYKLEGNVPAATPPTGTDGWEASYNSFVISGNLNNIGPFSVAEIVLGFTSGSQEAFGDAEDGGDDVGTGDNSSFAFNTQWHWNSLVLGFTPAINFTYGSCSADWQESTPAAGEVVGEDKIESSDILVSLGGVKNYPGGSRMAIDVGFRSESWEVTDNNGVVVEEALEPSRTVFPTCGGSGEWWAKHWWSIDWGARVSWSSNEFKETNNDATDGTLQAEFTDKWKDIHHMYGIGTTFRMDREAFRADLAFRFNSDFVGNPGAFLQGRNDDEDMPIVATELNVNF